MQAEKLVCVDCRKEFPLQNFLKCECGGILEVSYNYDSVNLPKEPKQLWDYLDFLPISDKSKIVSLQEGNTPLIKADRLGKILGLNDLYIKDETRNPTGSFKDRPNTVAVSKAKELGIDTVVVASSGNASASAAAYAAKGNLRCIVFIPQNASVEKLAQAKVYGAEIIKVNGDYSDAFNAALKITEKYGWYNVTSTYLNPYSVEGDKTIAYELFEQVGVPDYVLVPIGAGPLLYGIYKGFQELKSLGFIKQLPKMVGVQPEGCCPIVAAFEERRHLVKPWTQKINSIAEGVTDPLKGYENDGTLTLKIIYNSNGYGIKVDDQSLLDGLYSLAKYEGIFTEPAGSIGIGAVKKMISGGLIRPDAKIVVVATGHGLKNTKVIEVSDIKNFDEVFRDDMGNKVRSDVISKCQD